MVDKTTEYIERAAAIEAVLKDLELDRRYSRPAYLKFRTRSRYRISRSPLSPVINRSAAGNRALFLRTAITDRILIPYMVGVRVWCVCLCVCVSSYESQHCF